MTNRIVTNVTHRHSASPVLPSSTVTNVTHTYRCVTDVTLGGFSGGKKEAVLK
ncbi:MAG: hypothetical protein AAFP98_01400 [Pseudomonadota bacterium]